MKDSEQRRRTRLLSSLLLILTFLHFINTSLLALVLPDYDYWGRDNLILLSFALALTVAYLLNRLVNQYWIAAVISVAALPITFFLILILNNYPVEIGGMMITALIISILMADLFLSVRETVFTAGAIIIGTLLLPSLIPSLTLASVIVPAILLLSMTLLLLTGTSIGKKDLETAKAQARELEATHKASERVTFAAASRTSPEDLLNLVVNLLRDEFHLYHVQIYLVDEAEQAAVLRESTGYAGRQLLQNNHRIPLDHPSLVTKAIRQGEVVRVDDVTVDSTFMPNPLLPETSAELVLPLRVGERVLGVLDVQSRTAGRFTATTVTLFQMIGEQVAFVLENMELLQQVSTQTGDLTRFTQQLRTAAEMAERLSTILEPTPLVREAVELIHSRFGFYHAHIYLLDAKRQNLIVSAGSGEVGKVLLERGHTIPLDHEQSIVVRAVRQRKLILIDDVRTEPGFLPNPLLPQTQSEVAIPLIAGDRVLGVLDIQDSQPHRFSPADLDVFNTLAGQIATALDNAGLFEEQKRAEELVRRREAILQATSFAAARFLEATDWEIHIQEVLERLGEAAGASRAYIFENHPGADGEIRSSQRYEWCAEGITAEIDNPDMQDMSMAEIGLGAWSEKMAQGDYIAGHVRGMTDIDPALLLEQDIYSIAVVPIYVGGEWWGFMGFDACGSERDWSQAEVDILRTAAGMIGSTIERQRVAAERDRFTRQLRTAAEMTEQIGSILEPDELLERTVNLLQERFDFYHAHVYLLDAERQQLFIRAGSGQVGQQLREQGHLIPLDREQSIVARAARQRRLILVEDVSQEPGFLANPLLPDTQSEIAIPLIAGGRLLGVLDVQDDEPHRFTPADLDIFNTLAGQIATALDNAGLFKEQRRAEELVRRREAILQATSFAASRFLEATDWETHIQEVLERLGEATGVSRAYIFENHLEPDGEILSSQRYEWCAEGITPEIDNPDMQRYSHKELGLEAWEQKLLRGEHIAGNVREMTDIDPTLLLEQDIHSIVVMPIYVGGEWWGFMGFDACGSERNWSRAEVDILGTAAGMIGSTIERQRAAAELEASLSLQNATLESTADGILVVDGKGGINRFNQRFVEIWGIPQEVIDSHDDERALAHVLDRLADPEQFIAKVRELYEDPEADSFDVLYFKDGRVVERYSQPQRIGSRIVGRVWSFRDVTQRIRFTNQLRTAAEMAEQIGSILEPDELLERTVNLLQERFDFYHAHVYLLDAGQQQLLMRAGSGQVGQQLREQGHLIPLDREQSIVARAARQRRLVLVEDVSQEPGFLANPLLPDTQSEVAIPLIAGGRLLGVLDVQDDEPHRFTPADLDIFNTLAGQIATALDNASLFEEQKRAEELVRRREAILQATSFAAARFLEATGWEIHIQEVLERLGEAAGVSRAYIFENHPGADGEILSSQRYEWCAEGITPEIDNPDMQDMSLAEIGLGAWGEKMAQGGYIAGHVREMTDIDPPTLIEQDIYSIVVMPIYVGGEWWGFMGFDACGSERDWSGAEVDILRTAAGMIGSTIERQRVAAERDRFTRQLRIAAEMAEQIGSILEPDELLERTVNLLQERFDFYHAHVYLLDAEQQQLFIRAGSGQVGQQLREQGHLIPLDREQSLVARAARQRKLVLVEDVSQEPGFLANPLLPDTQSEVAIPLIAGGRLLGVLDVQDTEPHRFTPADLDIFNTLAGQIATAIDNAQLFAEAQETAERLRELDRLKSEFLANMSHELRTPLNSIIGYAEVMLMGLNGPLNEETTEDVTAILTSGRHLLRLINDILDLAKIEAGRLTLDIEEIPVYSLLNEVRATTNSLLQKKGDSVVLNIEVEEELPPLKGDRLRLNQILTNLLSNAIKFTDEGEIALRLGRSNGYLSIEVEDSGIGIPEESLTAIFEEFQQVDGSSTRRAEGTGLGLSITRHLVQMHGGQILVESELGKGSTFTVNLPFNPSITSHTS